MFRLSFWPATFWLLLGVSLGWGLHSFSPKPPDEQFPQTETIPLFEDISLPAIQSADDADYEYDEILKSYEPSGDLSEPFPQDKAKILEEEAKRLIVDNPRQAERMLNRWISKDEYNVTAMFLLAQVYAKTERWEDALDIALALGNQVQNIIPIETLNSFIRSIEGKYSNFLQEEEAFNERLSLYRKLTEYLPSEAQYYYKLAETQNRLGQFYEALSSLDYVLYDPDWSSRARSLLQEVEIKLELQEQVQIPLEREGDQFVVSATLNGISNVRLLLDTGASISLLRPQAAQQVGLIFEPSEREILLNTASGVVNAPAVIVNSFAVGDAHLKDVNVSVMEMPPSIESDGLLGMDFLSRFRFFINQDEGILYLGAR